MQNANEQAVNRILNLSSSDIDYYYAVLVVAVNATKDDIKKAYKGLARYVHPDKNPSNTDNATAASKILNKAYEVLSDDNRRIEYDKVRNNLRNKAAGSSNNFQSDCSTLEQLLILINNQAYEKIVKVLGELSDAKKDELYQSGRLLFSAILGVNEQITKIVIQHCPKKYINTCYEGASSPLSLAINGTLEVFQKLLDCGADITKQDADGKDVLHRLIQIGYSNTAILKIKLILKLGLQVTTSHMHWLQQSKLFLSANKKSTELESLLQAAQKLQTAANDMEISIKNRTSYNKLHWALAYENVEKLHSVLNEQRAFIQKALNDTGRRTVFNKLIIRYAKNQNELGNINKFLDIVEGFNVNYSFTHNNCTYTPLSYLINNQIATNDKVITLLMPANDEIIKLTSGENKLLDVNEIAPYLSVERMQNIRELASEQGYNKKYINSWKKCIEKQDNPPTTCMEVIGILSGCVQSRRRNEEEDQQTLL